MESRNSEEALSRLDLLALSALVIRDFDEAADALISLSEVDKPRARDTALQILHDKIGDVYYQSFAFTILYGSSFGDALAYLENNAQKESARVLGSMLSEVTMDSYVPEIHDEIRKAVSVLRQALALRPAEELQGIAKDKAWFEKTFPEGHE